MEINLEQIDILKERAHVSYEDAKEALEKSNGSIVEALIYLEKNNKIKEDKSNLKETSLWDKFLSLIKKGNNTRFVVKKKENEVVSMPVTLVVITALVVPPVVIIGLILAIITGYRIKFVGKTGNNMGINKTLDKVSDLVDSKKEELAGTESVNWC